ncbi:c-type cytochrome domain-containing protein [Roseimaritima ulvae]|uniref:c-type cytochrome domain-containing protein n=1 Tax=Roseimaritima ulvae TaxID=980254 RepID=UPI00082CCD88|nr:c-type cytochrome domain-containing protein [Roseimaritima ulvae]
MVFGVFLAAGAAADEPVSFRSDIAPLLQDRCVACHNAKQAEGGYRVDTFQDLLVAGDSEAAPVSHVEGEVSELLRRVVTDDESERMPAESEPLTEAQIQTLTAWIEAGAKFDGDDPAQPLSLVIPAPRHIDPPQTYPASVPIAAVAFSPDGQHTLASGYHEITVWDQAGKLLRRIPNIGQRVFAMAFSPDGATLAVACGEPGRSGEVRLLDFASGEVTAVLARSGDVAFSVAFRPGSDQLAVGSADSLIRIVNYKTLAEVRTLSSHADWVLSVSWSDDGSRLVSGSRDKSSKVFDAESGELLISYQGHAAAVRGALFTPDGKHVLSTGANSHLHRWNVADAKRVAAVALGGDGFRLVRGEGFVLAPSGDGRLLKIDLATNKISQEFKGHQDGVLAADLHAASGQIVSGAFDGEVRLWQLADGTAQQHWLAKP